MSHHSFVSRSAWGLALLALCVFALRCGGSGTTTAPSGKITLSGFVQEIGTLAPIAGAKVEVTGGVNVGQAATTDGAGKYVLGNLTVGAMTLKISAPNYLPGQASVSPTADQTSTFTLAAGKFSTSAQLVDAVSGAPISGASANGTDIGSGTSDANGAMSIYSSTTATGARVVNVSSPGTFLRVANLRIPGSAVTIDLIPSSFDLTAFDQLLRSASFGFAPMDRWTTAPGLIVETRTLKYDAATGLSTAVALSEQMSDAEAATMVGDMSFALPLLTGGTFSAFSSVTIQTSAVGATVNERNPGAITVSRQLNITTGTDGLAAGLGSWSQLGSVVTGGTIGLDRDFDFAGVNRIGVRYHELGHALGYNHVLTRFSIMNPNCCTVVTPNQFDQQATQIAFRRAPGSLTPDKDAGTSALNITGASTVPVWSAPIR